MICRDVWCTAVRAVSLLIFATCAIPLSAQWSSDTSASLRVCINEANQQRPKVVPDNAGGAIVVWEDSRSTSTGNGLYAQRISGTGARLWAAAGQQVIATFTGALHTITACGDGTTIIAWRGTFNAIWAQRINSSGTNMWSAGGSQVTSAPIIGLSGPRTVTDGSQGAVIVWAVTSGSTSTLWAQRVNSSGNLLWQAGGVPLGTAPNTAPLNHLNVIADGSGGAFVSWDSQYYQQIYAQHVDATGQVQFGPAGQIICTASANQQWPHAIADGSGGMVLSWDDSRTTATGWDRYAQRFTTSGTMVWNSQGVPTCTVADWMNVAPRVNEPSITSDGSGGAILAWDDDRTTSVYDVFVQRVTSSGTANWTLDGVRITNTSEVDFNPLLVPDGQGGAIILWGSSDTLRANYRAQRVSAGGTSQWLTGGIPVATAYQQYKDSPDVSSDGSSGAYLVWHQSSGLSNTDRVYIARIYSNGSLVPPPAAVKDWMLF